MMLFDLADGDVFRTKRKYALFESKRTCNTFLVVKKYIRNDGKRMVKCLSCDWRNPTMKFFNGEMDVTKL